MKSVKNKLSSKSGASMLLALVFLMFCMFVGGSVLAAATANGSRAARQKENQQVYLSQRSASLLLADMLKSTDEAAMQLTIKDVSVKKKNDAGETTTTRKLTIMAHGKTEVKKSLLHKLLYELAISRYVEKNGVDITTASGITPSYINFNFLGQSGAYSYAPPDENGTILLDLSEEKLNDVTAYYSTNADADFVIEYIDPDANKTPVEDEKNAQPQHSYVTMSMKCYTATSNPVTVDGVTTTTTIIRWDDPVIEKGGE